MVHLAAPVSFGPDLQRLRSLFFAGLRLARRRGRRTLVSAVVPVLPTDPLLLFSCGVAVARERLFWSSQNQAFSLAAVGAAGAIAVRDAGRFDDAARAWRDLTAQALIDTSANEVGTGPVLLGGFSFDPQRPATPDWAGFPDGLLFLPRYLLTTNAGRSWLTINTLLRPEADVEQELASTLEVGARLLASAREAELPESGSGISTVEDVMPATDWQAIVASVVQDLQRHGLDKVVLARSCRVRGSASFDPALILRRLRATYPNCFVFAVARGERCFLGASPEQLVSLRAGQVRATCLAGSIRRGANAEEDRRLGDALLTSAKDRAEHAIVVRAIREALAEVGADVVASGEPVLLKLPNVQHLQTTVTARAASSRTILDLVDRLHPTPAVGGYPRTLALAVIRDREQLDRGWYAGPVGWLDARGEGEFAVALRSALLRGAEALLFAGCGIVSESDPVSEYAESCLKLRPILSALEGEPRGDP